MSYKEDQRLYGDIARAYFKSKKVYRYRMKKISDMDDQQVIRACHFWYEENNLVEDYQAFQARLLKEYQEQGRQEHFN